LGDSAAVEIVFRTSIAQANEFMDEKKLQIESNSPIRTRPQLTKKAIAHLLSLQLQPQRLKKFFRHPNVAYSA
jgi:hypothetical protein